MSFGTTVIVAILLVICSPVVLMAAVLALCIAMGILAIPVIAVASLIIAVMEKFSKE